jgi:hypothetical protein
MPVTVQITEGPLIGEEFELNAGMKLGRTGSDLNLKDPKISSMHAEVRMRTGSIMGLVIFDLGSTNGIKVKGRKVPSLDLSVGTIFQLGNTTLKVVKVDVADMKEAGNELSDWRAHLIRTASAAQFPKKSKFDVKPFEPIVHLNFLEGPQKGEKFVLGYGPRTLGMNGTELSLLEASVTEASFELLPLKGGGVEFKTKNSDKILLNGLSKESEMIRTGDTLDIGQTKIEITFTK